MKPALAAVALFLAGALADTLQINTPANVVECQPSLITWSGGTPPYTLSILPGATPNGQALETFNSTSSTSLTWVVNIAANTNIGLTLRDSTGLIAQSAAFTVGTGTSSCTNTTSVIAGPTGASNSAAATTGGATAATTGGSAATGTSAGSTPSGTTSKSGAAANVAQFSVTAVVGAALAVLFM